MNKIILRKKTVEEGLNTLIDQQRERINRLNRTSACTQSECLVMINDLRERDTVDYILNYLIGINTFQFMGEEFEEIEIRP